MTEAGWRETGSEAFARIGEIFTPGREEIEKVVLDHIPAERDESFPAVDVGSGSGWLGAAVLHECPGARLLRSLGRVRREFVESGGVGVETTRAENAPTPDSRSAAKRRGSRLPTPGRFATRPTKEDA